MVRLHPGEQVPERADAIEHGCILGHNCNIRGNAVDHQGAETGGGALIADGDHTAASSVRSASGDTGSL